MFNKATTFRIDKNSVEFLDGELLKTAALKLPDGIKYDPDYFYMKVRAVSAGEYWGCNKNFDYFPEMELIKNYKTFLTAHTFKNHENKNIENAIGDVLTADWNDKMKGVDLLLRIDRRIAPTIVRGFEKGFMTDVSMGCRIDYSICSYCGNKAKTKYEYCEHIKTMRGKVFDDGRKVYEINIGPKFHDISAVLNGAERVAKATGLLIVGNKVAFELPHELEKVASFQEEISQACDEHNISSQHISKVANYDGLEIFLPRTEKIDKKASVQKVAEIKKEIQSRILNLAKGEILNGRENDAEDLMKTIKLLYTNYWEKSKCIEIAKNIKLVADRKEIPLEVAFEQFLNVVDFAGIELTPLEIHDIFHALMDIDTPDLRQMDINDDCAPGEFMSSVHQIIDGAPTGGLNIPSLFKSISLVEPHLNEIIPKLTNNNPAGQLRAVVIKVGRPVPSIDEDVVYNELMHKIVAPLMPERSAHRRFLIKRLERVADGHTEPNLHNKIHFMPTKMMAENKMIKHAGVAPYILSGMLHALYENERVAHFNSPDFEYGLSKFASYIEGYSMNNILNEFAVEKTAKVNLNPLNTTKAKAVYIGIPAMYAYSALQRARVNNGENLSSFNRYIAENPGNAAVLEAALVPVVVKKGKMIPKNMIKGVKNFDKKLVEHYASEEEYFDKVAEYDKILYNKNMFEDKFIHDELIKKAYTEQQITAMKYACVLSCMERQDAADEVLEKCALDENDLSEYLKTAKDCIRIEIEKNASAVKDVAEGMANSVMFHKGKGSVAAILPGAILDGVIFSKLFNSKKINK
jgi:hypothetical protein